MAQTNSPDDGPGARPDGAANGVPHAGAAPRLPVPVPLLLQLCRPLNTLDDVQALAAQLASARARGCF
jgi:hypothetical protein